MERIPELCNFSLGSRPLSLSVFVISVIIAEGQTTGFGS